MPWHNLPLLTRLSTKIFLAIVLCTFAGMFAVGLFAFTFTRTALERSLMEQQVGQAKQMINTIDRTLYERISDIEQISGEEAIEAFLKEPEKYTDSDLKKELRHRLNELSSVTGPWDVLFVVNNKGQIVLSAGEPRLGHLIQNYPAKWIAYQVALKGENYYSDLVISKDTGLPTVIFSVPIIRTEDPGKVVLGAVIGNLSWPAVLEILGDAPGHAVLLNREGKLIGNEESMNDLETITRNLQGMGKITFPQFLSNRAESIILPKVEGIFPEQTVTSIATQSGYLSYRGSGWRVLLSAPTGRAFASATSTAARLVFILVPIILVAAIIFLYAMRRLVFRPLESLQLSIQTIAKGDLTQRIPINANDEIGLVATTFNQMSEKLEDFYGALEAKVAERTQELESSRLAALNMMQDAEASRTKAEAIAMDLKREIAEREKIQSQLMQSQKMEAVGKLSGGIAHDFNNLLTVINGYAELLLQDLNEGDPRWGPIDEIFKAGRRAKELTNQLLTFSRRQIVQPKIFNLNELIADMGKMIRRLMPETIEFSTRLGTNLGLIQADPGQIQQVIVNMVVNAGDAMTQGGKLYVETKNTYLDELYSHRHEGVQPGEYVLMEITDTGPGMDQEVQKHIFEPFFTTKPQGKGTGLGLATSFGIVKQAGGHLWFYSEPGKGTSFKIYFPRIRSAETHEIGSSVDSAIPPRGTETILLVEDETVVREFAKKLLTQYGYQVLDAAHGELALELIKKLGSKKIHLLFSDIVMPHMGGRELAQKLQSQDPDLKIILTSGYTDDFVIRQGISDASLNFIQKPFTARELLLKVRTVLDS